MNLLVVSILLNVTYLFAAEEVSLEGDLLLYLPFVFLDGPVLCFAAHAISDRKFSPWKVTAHLMPFLLAIIFYVLRCVYPVWFDAPWIRASHFTIKTLFLLFYALYILFFNHGNGAGAYKPQQKLVQLLAFLALICAMIFIIFTYNNIFYGDNRNGVPVGSLIYVILFIMVFLVFRYTINSFVSIGTGENGTEMEDKEEVKRYQKSTLSEALLDSYEQKLYALMIRQMIFLNAELSLQSLAKELRIPKHHLTQVLSVRVGENFYHYVNRFRIDYACKLINKSVVDLTLEELAYKSGFNSKTSFNRYFKKQVGCTPSEYRNL
ncbi:helix-turn-helix domain-containing protein [Pedobacter caeni]|nr:helix-turn-helix domain-containing protein [Pedobacter caeni]